jgi:hypothetical protein
MRHSGDTTMRSNAFRPPCEPSSAAAMPVLSRDNSPEGKDL